MTQAGGRQAPGSPFNNLVARSSRGNEALTTWQFHAQFRASLPRLLLLERAELAEREADRALDNLLHAAAEAGDAMRDEVDSLEQAVAKLKASDPCPEASAPGIGLEPRRQDFAIDGRAGLDTMRPQ